MTCIEFLELVNFVDFVGCHSCTDDLMCHACKEIDYFLKNGNSALLRPIATVDGDSNFLIPFSHEQLQELIKYIPLELDAHLWDVYEVQILLHLRKSDFQVLDMIDIQ